MIVVSLVSNSKCQEIAFQNYKKKWIIFVFDFAFKITVKLFCEKMRHCEILLEIKVGKKCPHKAHKHCFNRSDFPPFDLFHKIVIDLCVSATTTVLHLSRNGNSFRRIFHLYLSSRTSFSLYRFCWWHSFRKLSGREYCTCSSRSTEVVILLGEGESRPKEYAGLSWSSSLKLEQKLTRGASVVMGKLSPEKKYFKGQGLGWRWF